MPLTKWVKAFPAMSSLHPFEAALLDLTVGQGTYASVLGKVDSLRKSLQEVRVHVRVHVCVYILCVLPELLRAVLPGCAAVLCASAFVASLKVWLLALLSASSSRLQHIHTQSADLLCLYLPVFVFTLRSARAQPTGRPRLPTKRPPLQLQRRALLP